MTKFRESALEDRWEAKAARINVHRAKRFQELHRSKVRAIGICEQELRQQVKDHEQRELNEREEELAYAQYIGKVADEMQVMENEHTKERRRKRQELQNVWDLQHKMRSKRAEWDLSDPKQLAKDSLPMEETSGPSSAQFIKGIPDSKELDREKKRAQHKLIDETLKEREAKLALDRLLEAEDAELARQQLALRLQRELEDAKKRKDYDAYVRKINDQLIELKKLEAANLKAIEDARAAREHQYIEENKDLRETRSKMYNSAGKIVRQEWKGMTPTELARIAQEQRDQAEAVRLAREQERKNNRAEEENFERARLLALQMENQAELARRTKAKQVVGCIQLQDQIYQEKRDERRRYDQEPAGGWWPFSSADR